MGDARGSRAGWTEAMRGTELHGCLAPLYQDRPGLAWTHDIGGLRFVGVDNSLYQVDEQQQPC